MPVLESSTFRLTLPEGWQLDVHSTPVAGRGPSGEAVIVSASRMDGDQRTAFGSSLHHQLLANARTQMEKAASHPRLTVIQPPTEQPVGEGNTFLEMRLISGDGETIVAQFAMAGYSSVVLVAFESPARHAESLERIRDAVMRIEWIKPATTRWWKFW